MVGQHGVRDDSRLLASELGVSHARVKLALASYSVALIMTAVAGGRLADILGRKRMFIIGGLAFSAAALLGLTVTNLWSLVAVRAFAGLSAALVLTATGRVLVSTMHGTTRHDGSLLWRGAGMAGMVLGPVIGPLVASGSTWRSLFVADAVFMLIAVGLGAYSMKERRDKDSVFTVALLLPAVLLGLGLLSPYLPLLLGKEGVASWPLSVAIVVPGIACLCGFVLLNRRSSHPLFDTNIFLPNRRLSITDLFGAIHVGALFVVVTAFPVILDADARSLVKGNRHPHAGADDPLDHVASARASLPRAIRAHPGDRDTDRVQPHRPQHGVVVCGRLPEPDVSHDLAVAPADGHWIRPDPPLRPYGRHQADRQTVGIHALRHTDLQQPRGAAVGRVLIGYVLPATSMNALSNDPQIAQQAALVAAVAVAVVVVSSTIFAAFKDEYLGVEDPHWHKPKKQSPDPPAAASTSTS